MQHYRPKVKTQYIYELVQSGVPCFLSRPRRFGKSLLLSTMRAYFEGKKELFEGLKIAELEGDGPEAWLKYPVFYFDFNKDNFKRNGALEDVLKSHLTGWESIYGDQYRDGSLASRFQNLIQMAAEQTGLNAVVLVDEYDKPLLEVMEENELEEQNALKKKILAPTGFPPGLRLFFWKSLRMRTLIPGGLLTGHCMQMRMS